MNKQKILLLGVCDYSLLRTISKNIKKHIDVEIHVLNLFKTGLPLVKDELQDFDGIHCEASKNLRAYSKSLILKELFILIFSLNNFTNVIKNLLHGKVFSFLKNELCLRIYSKKMKFIKF